jgi:hypothetical protein
MKQVKDLLIEAEHYYVTNLLKEEKYHEGCRQVVSYSCDSKCKQCIYNTLPENGNKVRTDFLNKLAVLGL